MNEDMYRVILSGNHLEDQGMEEVKNRMADLFKTSTAVIEELFSRQKAVIKRNLNIEAAERYAKAIKNTGAACYVEKMSNGDKRTPSPTPPSTNTRENQNEVAAETDDAPSATGGLRVIPVQMTYKGDERFFPQQVDRLSAFRNGISFNEKDFSDVNYNQISALAAYAPPAPNNDSIRFLVFLKNREQPFVLDAGNIDYSSFQSNPPIKTAAAFRSLLHFLCRQNATMILEETTFDFLSGNTLPEFSDDKAMKYITAIGRLLEEGSDDEEG